MKKILHYYPSNVQNGGPKVYIETIVNSALKEKCEFDRAGYNKKDDGSFLRVYRLLRDYIKKTKPDIVHIHGCQSEGFVGVLAARAGGCKSTVLTVHGFAFDDTHTTREKKILYRRFIEPITLRRAGAVYCVCEYAEKRDIVRKNAGKRLIGHIYNPAPPYELTEDRESVRNELGYAPDDVVCVIAARISIDKGFDVLMKTIKLAAGDEKLKFLILGNGDYKKVLEKDLSEEIEKKKVILYGSTDRVYDFLAASDMYVFPSYHENCSIALIEAGRAGLATVSSPAGGNPEIVLDGETGIIVPEWDPKAYYDALKKLYDDPSLRERMGQKAQDTVIKKFSQNEIMEEIYDIYENYFSRIK